MPQKTRFHGLRTVIYAVGDIEAATAWYTRLLEKEPYFVQPFYVGFEVGGYELGLDPNLPSENRCGNVVAYWGVDDASSAYLRAIAVGAGGHTPPRDVGEGIVVASVVDPYGNVIGIIENPGFAVKEGASSRTTPEPARAEEEAIPAKQKASRAAKTTERKKPAAGRTKKVAQKTTGRGRAKGGGKSDA